MTLSTNPELELAHDYVQYTDRNIFLTGKAGTGKTTFLHRVKAESIKRTAVVAPTGVAAINAGGMTIHSLFQLPFGPYLPNMKTDLSRQRRFSKRKIKLIKSLDLLIIDEISMVRSDVLDSMDEVLRRYRDRTKPFGGVQLLMIGDLHQLPPVVKQDEWRLLQEHYSTPYFFGSNALQQTQPVTIQLKHIYRQSDDRFIRLLNKVRNNQLDEEVLDLLNSRFIADFQPAKEKPYITLTSHNASAKEINEEQLQALEGKVHRFSATIEDDFPPHIYPTDEHLEFKVGAQVLFIKNDTSPEKEYYNGKIGQITRIEGEAIVVQCPGEERPIFVYPADWQNVKYKLDEATKEVTEDIVGTFTQYPLKLAWAITIHKSQGLTFERAIIDAEAAFAHGQVYVALSRCKSLEGIVLRSRIGQRSVRTDTVVQNYSEKAAQNAPNEEHLQQAKHLYQQNLLTALFDFKTAKIAAEAVHRVFLEYEKLLTTEALQTLIQWMNTVDADVFSVADKFRPQLRYYFRQGGLPEENKDLKERLTKAGDYFVKKLEEELLPGLRKVPVLTENKVIRKSAVEKLKSLERQLVIKKACFAQVQQGFSPQAFLRAKANADADYETRKPTTAATATIVPDSCAHPKLYLLLDTWRKEQADELEKEPYQIIPARTLLELTQFLPTDGQTLRKVKGIGKVKSERFGTAILDIINTYCAENNIAGDQLHLRKPVVSETKKQSFELFQAGKSVDEIAEERGLKASTIEGHLAHYIGAGELDIFKVLERQAVEEMVAAFQEQDESLTAVRARLDNRFSFGHLRLVQAHVRRQETVE